MLDRFVRGRLVLALFAFAALGAAAAAQDVLYHEHRELTLAPDPTRGYALTERTEVRVEFVSQRSTRDGSFYVSDAFFAPVDDLRAEWNGRRLRGEHVQSFTPPSADVFLSPGSVWALSAPETPEPGDVMSYTYRRAYVDLAYAPLLRVPSVDRVESYKVTVRHPDDVTVGFEVYAPRAAAAHRVDRPRPGETTLTFERLDALDVLPLFPHNGEHATVMLTIADAAGTPVLPTRPDDFAVWYRTLTRRAAPDTLAPALATLAEDLRRETDVETVAAIHDHVRGAIRYVADERDEGAFVPRAPDLVHARGYGDCKDRAFLVAALARELGLEVDVVLLSTEPVAEFDAAHFALYNHVIAAFETEEGETVYFDPTHRYVPFGALPEGDVDAQALRIGPDGAERVRIAAPDMGPTFDVEITASLDAPDEGVALVTVRGSLLGAVEEARASGARLDVENILSGATGRLLYKIRLDRFVPVSTEASEATFSAVADLSEFVVASPTRRYLPHTPFRSIPSEVAERSDDAVAVYTDWRPDARLVLDLDTGSRAAAPQTVHLGEADGAVSFSADLALVDGRTVVDYRFRQRARRFEGADREAYLALARSYLDARPDMFIFRPVSEEAAAETP